MSLPITAVGPLKVETKPILMVSPAKAGFASARTVAPASQNAVLIMVSLPRDCLCRPSTDLPRSGSVRLRFRASLCQMPCFVREMAVPQQARTDGSFLEPSAHGQRFVHHNSYRAGMARIIVQIITMTKQPTIARIG